ncbi:MAG: pilus assembly protein [Novosphingobium sp.]|uniref:TadE/TadG family type IV pilus assembly protein n=1 Tax=Novosphingobium sp. TaxID=1874826 RepID=UPI002735CBE0|nr:TadE family protein [Novosphingobium sp.]MDP3550554.1 pilus assembly protein [Novosphingobium sp.]
MRRSLPLAQCVSATARRLRTDKRGVTTIEFALVAPVFLMVIVGCLDLGQMVYAKGVLDGAVEKAARDSSLETGDTSLADGMVKNTITKVLPNATVSSTRKSYFDFTNANKGEDLDDENGDGECSEDESFTDLNGNDRWDEDLGEDGNGGANDVIVYTVTVAYDPVFAVPLVPIDWSRREIESTAVKRNQPFALQDGSYTSQPGKC